VVLTPSPAVRMVTASLPPRSSRHATRQTAAHRRANGRFPRR
jgi:hypothetical protein